MKRRQITVYLTEKDLYARNLTPEDMKKIREEFRMSDGTEDEDNV